MLVTAEMLRAMGIQNVLVVDDPTAVINGHVVCVKPLRYKSLDEVKLANWFSDAAAGAVVIITEGAPDYSPDVVLRMYSFSMWEDTAWHEDQRSPLALHRLRAKAS